MILFNLSLNDRSLKSLSRAYSSGSKIQRERSSRDRGVGIPLAHQGRIFERFYRVDEAVTRSRDGTGLGLAIAKSLIEGMQGKITLRSKPGEGSTFTIILPSGES